MSEGKYLVLLVEDDRVLRVALTELMSSVFDVVSVGTLADASERISEMPYPDVVLLDLILPNGAGIDLINKFKHGCPSIPIVIYTGYAISEKAALDAGAVAILMKPVTRNSLIKTLSDVVASYIVGEWYGPVERNVQAIKDELESLAGRR